MHTFIYHVRSPFLLVLSLLIASCLSSYLSHVHLPIYLYQSIYSVVHTFIYHVLSSVSLMFITFNCLVSIHSSHFHLSTCICLLPASPNYTYCSTKLIWMLLYTYSTWYISYSKATNIYTASHSHSPLLNSPYSLHIHYCLTFSFIETVCIFFSLHFIHFLFCVYFV